MTRAKAPAIQIPLADLQRRACTSNARAGQPLGRSAQGAVVGSLVTHRSTASACLDGPDHPHRLCERTLRRHASDLDRRSRRRDTAEQYQRTAVPVSRQVSARPSRPANRCTRRSATVPFPAVTVPHGRLRGTVVRPDQRALLTASPRALPLVAKCRPITTDPTMPRAIATRGRIWS
jgi:hypothetical protein